MLLSIVLLLLSAVAIYLACEYFVNGVEWLGRKLSLSATATGTVLAAFGTALPESAVTLVAVVFGKTPEQKQIGVGAALGGPLVLSTISYAVVGLVLLFSYKRIGRANQCVQVDGKRLSRDQSWFLCVFALKVLLGLIAFSWKSWLGFAFLAAYGLYIWHEMREVRSTDDDKGVLEPLKLRPKSADPGLAWTIVQTTLALLLIAAASRVFVHQLDSLSIALHMPAQLVALLLSPVATELPETMNALIWVRQGKEKLALANISGAMMIQATIPSSLALFATPWLFDVPLMAAGVVTMIAVIALWVMFRRGAVNARWLMPVGLLYGVFALFVGWFLSR
jgi:cation:H+ antiporter